MKRILICHIELLQMRAPRKRPKSTIFKSAVSGKLGTTWVGFVHIVLTLLFHNFVNTGPRESVPKPCYRPDNSVQNGFGTGF